MKAARWALSPRSRRLAVAALLMGALASLIQSRHDALRVEAFAQAVQ
jgi:hypothetical protein